MADAWPPPKRRTLVEEDSWRTTCDAIEPDIQRMDELLDAVTDLLARYADVAGEHIERDTFGYVTRPWPGAPGVVVFYSFDDDFVYLKAIHRADEPPDS